MAKIWKPVICKGSKFVFVCFSFFEQFTYVFSFHTHLSVYQPIYFLEYNFINSLVHCCAASVFHQTLDLNLLNVGKIYGLTHFLNKMRTHLETKKSCCY